MFDPSKLGLDLNNLDKENIPKESESEPEKQAEINKEFSEVLTNSNKTPTTPDVLDILVLPEIDKFDESTQTMDMQDLIEVLDLPKENTSENTEVKDNTEQPVNQIWRTEYEKSIMANSVKTEIKKEDVVEEKIIYDINIVSLEIFLEILVEKKYDFATFEPSENYVKIDFRKDKIVKETKYIKYPTYSNILIKAKTLTKLTIEETENEQEWEWEIFIKDRDYKIITKVVPSSFWSKLFIKAKEAEKKVATKEIKKISIGKIFMYLWVIAFIALVIWGAFMSFVVLNAKTVDDVKFFYSLWINLNDINSFILQAVTLIFSIVIFIEVLFLIFSLTKFLLTKKEFKQKKIRYGILGVLILFLAFWSGTGWMIIDKKIRSLPNWQEMAYWDIQVYDNSKLVSKFYDKWWSLLTDTTNLIGPMQIKYDVNYLAKNEERKWLKIKKYKWDFWDGKEVDSPIPTIIYDFNEKKNYEVKLTLEEVDMAWKIIEKPVENLPNINITYVIKINEKKLNNWWKLVDFDASTLKELGKLEWYFLEDLEKPVWTWDVFRIWKPIFADTFVWMYIKRNDKTTKDLDKVFIISWQSETTLWWEIKSDRSVENDLEYEFRVENAETDFWNGVIEEYKWIIWDKEITKVWDPTNQIEASKIKFSFETYWEQTVKVILKDSTWETKEISVKVDIPKRLLLNVPLKVQSEWVDVTNLKYDKKLNEYYIDEIWVPTELTLDARFIKSNNLLYTLKKVSFDYNSDWDIDEVTKVWKYTASTEWNHTITVHYEFVNRKIATDIINMQEKLFIEWIKKEAIILFDINKNSPYVPVVVWFDASKSQVKDENIDKFIWNYWDWVEEERDAIVEWHKYATPWEYTIKLKVITTSWKEYSLSKKLILKPKPQTVKITTSLTKAPIWQWIDFLSEESEWQIVWYFWDFWDWDTSTEANPTHAYKKAWEYKVVLKLDFANKNILEDKIDIIVVE